MEERKGLFTPDEQKFLATVLDFWFKFKNAALEKIDSWVFELIIKGADDYGLDRIPETWKLDLIPIIDAAMQQDKEKVRLLVVDLMNKRINIPKLDDEQEILVFDAFSKFVATAIDFYVQKKAA